MIANLKFVGAIFLALVAVYIIDIGHLAGQKKQEAADSETPINYDESKVPDYSIQTAGN